MFNKNKLLSIALLLIILSICIGTVSANDNITDIDHGSLEVNSNVNSGSSILSSNYDSVNDIEVNDNVNSVKSNGSVNNQILKTPVNDPVVLGAENDGSFKDLNDLINSGNNIVLIKNYTYNPSTDSAFINGIKISKSITIDGKGYTINGLNIAKVFDITSSSVTIRNLNFINTKSTSNGGTITFSSTNDFNVDNCTFTNVTSSSNGGAIYIKQSNGQIVNSKFNNVSSKIYGGAINIEYSHLNILNSSFVNISSTNGGAISSINQVNILNCVNSTFINTSTDNGGSLYLWGTFKINNCLFINTNASNEGGAVFSSSSLYKKGNLNNCTFINSTGKIGGAIYLSAYGGTINSSNFINSSGESGGAIYVDSFNSVVDGSNFVNCSGESGGSIYYAGDNGKIYNSNFTNSTANLGGAIYWDAVRNGYIYNSNIKNSKANNGSAIYNLNRNLNITNGVILDNQAKSSSLTIDNTKSPMVITFTGNNNLFNGIFTDYNVYVNNLTYWGVNGVMNTGNVPGYSEPTGFTQEGIDVIVTVFDYDDNLIFNRTYTTDADGKIIVELSGLPTEYYYKLVAQLKNDTYYTMISNSTVYNNKTNITKTIINNITYGDQVIQVIFDSDASGTAKVIIDGKEYSGIIKDGILNLNIDIYPANIKSANITYSGNDKYNGFINKTVNFTIFKANITEFNIIVDDSTYGKDVNVDFTLVGVNNELLNDTITVNINGKDYTVTITNGKGSVVVPGLAAGEYDVVANFAGDNNYNASVNKTSFNVGKDTPSIKVDATDVTYGSDVVVNVDLIGVNDAGLNGTVTVTINGNDYEVTVVDGKGSLTVPGLGAGEYAFSVNYPGSENYTVVSASGKVNVGKVNVTEFVVSVDDRLSC
ncbi:hypothetical protein BGI41_02055 [Methanobrevibacter sp. 87.7]|uniref:beta strand repeat-containing protein n=1 Tax=Methanobrevibacter sp. 87.7 TaxID=387957 RepID=UPI000B4FF553|nr:Ig-like domain-containing protein [Methanobrevibacter sp. 87.7]OWT33502.1 hypothetical protein BGI41_02055 [Methanobrevibacter sp. 87.7]